LKVVLSEFLIHLSVHFFNTFLPRCVCWIWDTFPKKSEELLEFARETFLKYIHKYVYMRGSALPLPEKPTCFDKSVFQLNPPLRIGEIVFDDEIQLHWMKSASTADGWI